MSNKTGIQWTDETCSRCRQTKPAGEFPRDRSRARGFGYECKACRNRRQREGYVPKGRPPRRGWLVPTRDGDKKQARRRVNYLVEQGRIPRPDDLPCIDCADMLLSDGGRHEYDHAKGYDGPNQLYVEPVCQRCHRNREEARRNG